MLATPVANIYSHFYLNAEPAYPCRTASSIIYISSSVSSTHLRALTW